MIKKALVILLPTLLLVILSVLIYSQFISVTHSNFVQIGLKSEIEFAEHEERNKTNIKSNDIRAVNERELRFNDTDTLILKSDSKIAKMEENFVKLGIPLEDRHLHSYALLVHPDSGKKAPTLRQVLQSTGLNKGDFSPVEPPGLMPYASKWLAEKDNIQCVLSLHETQVKRNKCWVFDEILPQGQENVKIFYISITARRHPDAVSPLRKYNADYKTMKVEGGVVTFGE